MSDHLPSGLSDDDLKNIMGGNLARIMRRRRSGSEQPVTVLGSHGLIRAAGCHRSHDAVGNVRVIIAVKRTCPQEPECRLQVPAHETLRLRQGRAAIMLNRPDRERPEQGPARRANDAFLQAEADDEVRVVILGGMGPDVLVRPRSRVQGLQGGGNAWAEPASHAQDQRGPAEGAEMLDAAGVALLLREHPPLAESAQDHDRTGAW